MTVAVVACALLGVAVGPVLDVVITRVPAKRSLRRARGRATSCNRGERRCWPSSARPCSVRSGRSTTTRGCCRRTSCSPAALVALSWIDLEYYILPNRIVFPLAIAMPALLAVAAVGDRDGGALVRAGLAGVAAFAALFALHLISPRSMGFGDVKLAFVLGLALGWLGWGEVVLGLFLAFLYGAVVGVVLMVLRRRGRKDQVPFGPFLAAGTITAVLWGEAILRWYG